MGQERDGNGGGGVAKCLSLFCSQPSGLDPVIVHPVPGPPWSIHCVVSAAQDSGHTGVTQPCSGLSHSEEGEGQVHRKPAVLRMCMWGWKGRQGP